MSNNSLQNLPERSKYQGLGTYTSKINWVKFKDYLIIALFIVILVLPLQNFSLDSKQFNKSFWGRDILIQKFAEIRFRFLRDTVFDQVLICNNNWLAYIDRESIADIQHTNLFSDDQLSSIQKKLDALNWYFSQNNIVFIVVIPPDKNTIYPEYIPSQISSINPISRLDQLVDYEKKVGGYQIIDLRPKLFDVKIHDQIYYPDDSHWNPLGAHAAYEEIMKNIQKDIPVVSPHPISEYRVHPLGMVNGDIANLAAIQASTEKYTLQPLFARDFTEQRHKTDQIPKIVITTRTDHGLPKAIVFQDSFFDELIPLFADHFSKGIFMMSHNVDRTVIGIENPDIVIVEITERYMHRLLNLPDLP